MHDAAAYTLRSAREWWWIFHGQKPTHPRSKLALSSPPIDRSVASRVLHTTNISNLSNTTRWRQIRYIFLFWCLKFQNNSALTLPSNENRILGSLLPSLPQSLVFFINLPWKCPKFLHFLCMEKLEDKKLDEKMPWHSKNNSFHNLGCWNWQQHTVQCQRFGWAVL